MNKVLTVVGVFVVLILGVSALVYFIGGNDDSVNNNLLVADFESSEDLLDECMSLDISERDRCYYDKIYVDQNFNPSFCEQIVSDKIKSACFSSVALGSHDSSFCEKGLSVGICYWSLATINEDSSICLKIDEEKLHIGESMRDRCLADFSK